MPPNGKATTLKVSAAKSGEAAKDSNRSSVKADSSRPTTKGNKKKSGTLPPTKAKMKGAPKKLESIAEAADSTGLGTGDGIFTIEAVPPAIAADPIDPAVVGPPVSDLPALDEAAAATAPATEASEQGQGMKVLTEALQMVQELTGHDVTQDAERVLAMDVDGDGKIGLPFFEPAVAASPATGLPAVEPEVPSYLLSSQRSATSAPAAAETADADPPLEPSVAEPPTSEPVPVASAEALATVATAKKYAAFIAHFKAETAMEGRFLHEKLEVELGGKCFIDSDNLSNLAEITASVMDSRVLVLLQSKGVFERPWVLIETMTALEHGIPIVAVSVEAGVFAYDFGAAAAYLERLDTELERRNPGASSLLLANKIDLVDAAWKLSTSLPAIISVPMSPSASKKVLAATISDVADEIRKAVPLKLSRSNESFLQKRSRNSLRMSTSDKYLTPAELQHGSSVHHNPPNSARFAAFISHFKAEAAMEARYLQTELEVVLGKKVFLDSDDLKDLSMIKQMVAESASLIVLQTARIYERPWVLIEIATALAHEVPIVCVSLATGPFAYNHEDAAKYLLSLEAEIQKRNPGALAVLQKEGHSSLELAWKLSCTLPEIISINFDPSASKNVLTGTVNDVVDSIRQAAPLTIKQPMSEWLRMRTSTLLLAKDKALDNADVVLQHTLPPEVPKLPPYAVARPWLKAELKRHLLREGDSVAKTNVTVATGMGGVGKSIIATEIVNDEEVRRAFKKTCWVQLGQQPNIGQLQQILCRQLVKRSLPAEAKEDQLLALGSLQDAARETPVLLVLDDVWDEAHYKVLNFIDSDSTHSAILVTTRIRGMVEGASEVQCSTMTKEASLELLLRTGGCQHLLANPPPAALEAVELSGQLPLVLSLAGGIIAELADSWQTELPELLKEEMEEMSIEERMISASFRAMPPLMQAGVEGLFTLFGVFAEDSTVPAAALDALATLIPGDAALKQSAQKMRNIRKWLQQLLKCNILQGSIEHGVSAHDLVRDYMIKRIETMREGGIVEFQREAVPLLLAAFKPGGAAQSYVSHQLKWHVSQAMKSSVDLQDDAMLMEVLSHKDPEIHKQGALGVGAAALQVAADACDQAGDHVKAANLMLAAGSIHASAGGAQARRAWKSLQLLEEEGGGTEESNALELRVLASLITATEGGFAFGSPEHTAAVKRIQDLGNGNSQASISAPEGPRAVTGEAEYGLGMVAAMKATKLEGIADYRPMSLEIVEQAHELWRERATHWSNLAKAATDPSTQTYLWVGYDLAWVFFARQHSLPQFDPEVLMGKGGARLCATIERYNLECHQFAKKTGSKVDNFLFGGNALGLLLFWGDLKAMRAGAAKVLKGHKMARASVKEGHDTAAGFAFEMICSSYLLVATLLAAGALDLLGELMDKTSLLGSILTDEDMHAGVQSFWKGGFGGSWKTADGHHHSTYETWMMNLKSYAALVEEDTDASRAALSEWLPGPSKLLQICEFECVWRGHTIGANHPALLMARLHGERLGNWAVAVETAEGVLRIELFNPLIRVEAQLLLARAHIALEQYRAAHEAAEGAASEAKTARYVWHEMLALREMLRSCEADEAQKIKVRLAEVAGRLSTPTDDLRRVLGEDLLD